MQISTTANPTPVDLARLEEIHANPGFGLHFTDHMLLVEWTPDAGWHDARIQPYGPLTLDPATAVLHYAQETFEGMKAYRHDDGSVWTFRPESNASRLRRSAQRLVMPELPEELFLASLRELVSADQDWVPSGDGQSLYLRPFMIATESYLGVRPARRYLFCVIASPAGSYFGTVDTVDIWGRRRLAYEIKKKSEGIYAVVNFTSEPATAKELDRQLGLNESVMRTKLMRPGA